MQIALELFFESHSKEGSLASLGRHPVTESYKEQQWIEEMVIDCSLIPREDLECFKE